MALLQIAEPGESAAPHQHKLAVGIDLGTTNSLVATVRSGLALVLSDDLGRPLLPSVVTFCATREEAARGADALLLLTEWQEYIETTPETIKGLLKHPMVIDGRNVFDCAAMRRLGFTYYSMGRPPVIPA